MIQNITYNVIATLTVPVPFSYKEPIETLEDLEKAAMSSEHTIVTLPNTFYHDMLVNSQCCGAYYHIGQSIKRNDHLPDNTEAAIDMINRAAEEHRSVIFVYTSIFLFFSIRTYAKVDIHTSSEALMVDQMAMALQKGSPLLDTMNKA